MSQELDLNNEEMKALILQLSKNQEAMVQLIHQMNQKKSNSFSVGNLFNTIKNIRKNKITTIDNKYIEPTLSNSEDTASPQLELFNETNQDIVIQKHNNIEKQLDISEKKALKDKFINFKNMVGTAFVDFTDKFAFKSEKVNWYNLGHKTGISVKLKTESAKETFQSIVSAFSKMANKVGVTLHLTKNKADALKEGFALVGNKKIINNLHKNFTETLNVLGFEANDLYHDTKKEHYIPEEQVIKNVNNELLALQFNNENGTYVNEFIKNLDDEGKARTIHSALWPSLAEKIQEGMELTSSMSDFIKTNKYLNMISEFARKNNMSAEDVTNILEVDPDAFEPKHLLAKKVGFEKIKENYSQIMDNVNKFSVLAKNNHVVMATLVKATEDMKEVISTLNIQDDRKKQLIDSIDQSNVFKDKNGHVYRYQTIRKNVGNIIETQAKEVGAKIETTEAQVEKKEVQDNTIENQSNDLPEVGAGLKP